MAADLRPIQRPGHPVAPRIELWRHRALAWLKRLSRAWRYAIDRLTADDAQCVTLDCLELGGWHPLLILTVEDTLQEAREIFADHPQLPNLIARGCERVGRKWEAYGDELCEARRWAIDLAAGYAIDTGITLVRLGDQRDEVTGNRGGAAG